MIIDEIIECVSNNNLSQLTKNEKERYCNFILGTKPKEEAFKILEELNLYKKVEDKYIPNITS